MQNLYQPDVRGAYLIMCESYLKLNKPQSALNQILKYIKNNTLTPEICCMIGAIYNALNNYEISKFWFKSATVCDTAKNGFIQPEFKDIIPYLELTKIHYFLNDIKQSYYYHQLCVKTQPNNESVKHNICFFEKLRSENKI